MISTSAAIIIDTVREMPTALTHLEVSGVSAKMDTNLLELAVDNAEMLMNVPCKVPATTSAQIRKDRSHVPAALVMSFHLTDTHVKISTNVLVHIKDVRTTAKIYLVLSSAVVLLVSECPLIRFRV